MFPIPFRFVSPHFHLFIASRFFSHLSFTQSPFSRTFFVLPEVLLSCSYCTYFSFLHVLLTPPPFLLFLFVCLYLHHLQCGLYSPPVPLLYSYLLVLVYCSKLPALAMMTVIMTIFPLVRLFYLVLRDRSHPFRNAPSIIRSVCRSVRTAQLLPNR